MPAFHAMFFYNSCITSANGGPRWFSPPEGLYGVTAAQAAVSVIPAKAGIQSFKAFDKTGLLPRAGMASGAIRLKCYRFFSNGVWVPRDPLFLSLPIAWLSRTHFNP